MLHILLVILKVIGIILLAILGLLVLLVLIVLLSPIRYEAKGKWPPGGLKGVAGMVKATYLFGLVGLEIRYKNQHLAWRAHVAWIKRGSGKRREPSGADLSGADLSEEEVKALLAQPESGGESTALTEQIADVRFGDEDGEDVAEEEKEFGISEAVEAEESGGNEEAAPPAESPETEEKPKKIRGICGKIKEKVREIADKIRKIIRKIRDVINDMAERIRNAENPLDKLAKLHDDVSRILDEPAYRRAFNKVRKELFRLLKKLWPKHLIAHIHYGTGDPALTGQLLGIYCMASPWIGDNVFVDADFENVIFEADLDVKGKIRLIWPAISAVKLLLSKDVRKTIKDAKKLRNRE